MNDSKIFSTLDLKNGFFHVDVDKDSQKYTSFVTEGRQYAFLKASFGLCTSPNVFEYKFLKCITQMKDVLAWKYRKLNHYDELKN